MISKLSKLAQSLLKGRKNRRSRNRKNRRNSFPTLCRTLQAESLETRLCFSSIFVDDVSAVEGDSGTSIVNVRVRLEPPATESVTVDFDITGGTDNLNDDYFAPRVFTGFSDPTIVDNAGLSPREVAVGDVDEDGDADLLTVDPNNLVLKVFRNIGNGDFTEPSLLHVGGNPASTPELIDLNGDGHLDAFAYVRHSQGRLYVFPGNGDGTFGSPIQSGTLLFLDLAPLVVADINDDDRPDVVAITTTTSSDRVVTAFLNDGTGRFNQSYSSSNVGDFLDSPAPNRNPLIDAGDIDGDNRADIVLTTQEGKLWILRGNGDGTFTQSSITNSLNGDPLDSVKLADLNQDGALDLVMVDSGSDQVAVRLNDGAGNFSSIVAYEVGDFPVDLDVADVDGDGLADVVTANQGPQFGSFTLLGDSVSLLRGLGDGTFLAAEHFSAGNPLAGGTFPSDVVIADLNNDDTPDLVVGHGGASSTQATLLLGQSERMSSARIVFAPGQTVQNIPLEIVGDTMAESDETIVIRLSNPVGATIDDPEGQLTIEDDDTVLGSISGVVYEDVNGNGVRDADEPLLAGGKVYLDANNDGQPEASFVTDSSGNYLFSNLPAGDYVLHQQLQYSPQERWVRTSPADGSYTVSLSAGQDITGRDFGNFEPYSISGHVYQDLNGNSRFDPNEPVLRDFVVYIDNNLNGQLDPDEVSTTSGSDGRYKFTEVDQGIDGGGVFSNVVRVLSLPGWNGSGLIFVYASSGTDVTGIDRRVAPLPNSISGQTFDDRNGDGSRDADELGLASHLVYLDANDNGQLDMGETSTETNEHGFYAFTDLPAGNSVVRESPQEGWLLTAPADQFYSVNLTADQSVTGRDFGSRQATDPLRFIVKATDLAGVPISAVPLGEDFFLEVHVQDIRTNATGVFAAYGDLFYDNNKVSVNGPLEYSSDFPNARSGAVTTPGLVDEVGGVADLQANGTDELLLVRVPLTAEALGSVTFSLDPTDDLPLHHVLLFGAPAETLPANIYFGTMTIEVTVPNDPPVAHDDAFTLANCGGENLSVLNNDVDTDNDPLTIVAVAIPDQGGSVEITPNGLRYTPAPGFVGTETFTYTISDGGELTSEAVVTIEVLNPWHNYLLPEDVNNDGFVAPIDALLIINELNQSGGGRLQIPTASGCPTRLLDVTNDHNVAPIDALLVINRLNQQVEGEGEAPSTNVLDRSAEGEALTSLGPIFGEPDRPERAATARSSRTSSALGSEAPSEVLDTLVPADEGTSNVRARDAAFDDFADSKWENDALEEILSALTADPSVLADVV
ncbi:MAG: FG-GAP-like repeat-containing protein [Planctomycetota bacterium]|nr:FG-GAP-like repeat-containing protein [Planctomycetota bacterium]